MAYPTLLPPNATQGERAQEQVMAHMSDLPFDIRTVKNADLCSMSIIPYFAWEQGVTYWEEGWTDTQKRSAIKSSPAVNKIRGTPAASTLFLAAVGREIRLTEWWQEFPRAEPYTFSLTIIGESITPDEMRKTFAQAMDAKNARSYLRGIHIDGPVLSGTTYMGGTTLTRQTVTLQARRRDV